MEELLNKDKNSEREIDSVKEDGVKFNKEYKIWDSFNKEYKIGDSFSEKERNERRDKFKEIFKVNVKEENCK